MNKNKKTGSGDSDLSIDELLEKLKSDIANKPRDESSEEFAEAYSGGKKTSHDDDEASLELLIKKYLPREATPAPLNVSENITPVGVKSKEAKEPDFAVNAAVNESVPTKAADFKAETIVEKNSVVTEDADEEETVKIYKPSSEAESESTQGGTQYKRMRYRFKHSENAGAQTDSSATVTYNLDSSGMPSEQNDDFYLEKKQVPLHSDAGNDGEPEVPDISAFEEKPSDTVELDANDINLMLAFGLEDELAKTVGIDKVSEIQKKLDSDCRPCRAQGYEFTDRSQTKEIMADFKRRYSGVKLRLAAAIILTAIIFVFENIGLLGIKIPGVLSADTYPMIHVMVDLQLFVLCAALAYKSIFAGAKELFRMRPVPESITFAVAVVQVLYGFLVCGAAGADVRLYSFPAALSVLLTLLFEYMNLKRNIYSFNIVSSSRTKFAVTNVDTEDAVPEVTALYDHIPENEPGILRVRKTNFAENFFKRTCVREESLLNTLMIPLVIAAMITLFIVSYMQNKDYELALTAANITVLFCMPAVVFIANAYPLYRASRKAFDMDSAIIGTGTPAEYAGSSVIIFEDKDVYPSYGVKVKSVKVYGNNRIDTILYDISSLFSKVGGPLSDVFHLATLELGHSQNVELVKVDENGMEAFVDGKRVIVGKAAFLEEYGIYPPGDSDDSIQLQSGDISIMYVAQGDVLCAKLYVQYVMDADFEFIIKQLYKSGVCAVIKTFDPNIDDLLLSNSIKISKYPVKIVKCTKSEKLGVTEEKLDSGIISRATTKSLLQTVVLCDKLSTAIKTNNIIKLFALVVSLAVMIFLTVFSSANTSLPSLYIAIYQVFWLLPAYIVTKMYV